MNDVRIGRLFARLARLTVAAQKMAGDGTEWHCTLPSGESNHYVLKGTKSHAEVEDNAANLLIWIWNAKDYLKSRCRSLNLNARVVEETANNEISLAICADLANRLKHGSLDRFARSGHDPSLGVVSIKVPQSALRSIKIGGSKVEIDVENPDLVWFQLPVLDGTGREIGDAFELAKSAVAILEDLKKQIESDG